MLGQADDAVQTPATQEKEINLYELGSLFCNFVSFFWDVVHHQIVLSAHVHLT